jgi:hypothetical protein
VIDHASSGQIGRVAAVVAPALTVLAVILFMGAVSGAHLNPVVSVAFALRGDFQWRRVPAYIGAQLAGAIAAATVLRATFGDAMHVGATLPGPGFSTTEAFTIEALLTLGLVSTILGTASSAQNIGPLSALGVAAYIGQPRQWRIDEPSPVHRPSAGQRRRARPVDLLDRAATRCGGRRRRGLHPARARRRPRWDAGSPRQHRHDRLIAAYRRRRPA